MLASSLAQWTLTRDWRVVWPTNTAWLEPSGDVYSMLVAQNYFVHTPFMEWPLGANPSYAGSWCGNVFKTEVVGAALVKGLSGALGLVGAGPLVNFQVFGFLAFLNVLLVTAFAYLIFRHLKLSAPAAILAATVLGLAPVFLFRAAVWHLTAGAFWAVVAATYLYLAGPERSLRWRLSAWGGLFAACTLIHPYLLVPLALIWAAGLVRWVTSAIKGPWSWGVLARCLATNFGVVLAAIAVPLVVVTGSLGVGGGGAGAEGLGKYHANLLAPFDSNGPFSRLVPDIPTLNDGWDYEGYAFLGAAGLIAVGLATFLALRYRRASWLLLREHWPLIAACAVLVVYATGGVVALGPNELFSVPMSDGVARLLATFRSSGRFMSDAVVILLLIALGILGRLLPHRAVAPVLLAVLLVSVADAWPAYREQQARDMPGASGYGPLESIDWSRTSNLVFVLPENSGYQWKFDAIRAASEENVPTNDAFCARPNDPVLTRMRDTLASHVRKGQLDETAAYVFYPGAFTSVPKGWHLAKLGDGGAIVATYRAG